MSAGVAPWLLAAPVALPLGAGLLMTLLTRGRSLLTLIAGTGVLIAVLLLLDVPAGTRLELAVGGWPAPLGIRWHLDLLATVFLISTAVIALAVALFAALHLSRSEPAIARHFWAPLLFVWAALNALFLSADVFNLYVTLELLTLAAVMLVTLENNQPALDGAMRYLLVALAGSTLYLLGVALFYHATGTLDLMLAAGAVPPAALALMTIGLMAKGALFPLHAWLPPAHAAAPAPGSALLSALVVKASFYILLRLWLESAPNHDAGRILLGLCGTGAVIWGSLLALTQARLKLVVAYSTVAQLGYLLLVFPLAQGAWTGPAFAGGVWLAVSHGLAKAAMFLSAGLVMYTLGHDRIAELRGLAQHAPLTLFTFGIAGVTLMGLPPSGGFVAKWLLLTAAFGSGQWPWALVLLGGGLLAAVYTFRIIGAGFSDGIIERKPPRGPQWIALVLAGLALLAGVAAELPLLQLQEAAP
ncbi:MAG: proton-conducting transporter membrane subunit [Thiogranum sp.]|nr:proton-conducting transporter membrane subunit [Thiogranum sp.]